MARIRVGIGGWVFPPWRGIFYPPGLPQAQELAYASRHVSTIEINATFYGAQKPASFRRWHAETPDDFVFSVKGPRFATQRRDLSGAGPAIDRFFGTGVLELGDKLGPVLWQLAPTVPFDEANVESFLTLLPRAVDGRSLRHVIEVRHPSFADRRFVAALRRHGVALAWVDSEKHPAIEDVTADFVYARLERSAAHIPTGYPPEALDGWARRLGRWAAGGEPDDARSVGPAAPAAGPRDGFVYFISGAKVHAPAAATALIERLG